MNDINTETVDQHYGIGGIMDSVMEGLKKAGKDLNNLELADLAPVDEFHTRGRESTLELCAKADFKPNEKVLDVGCGLGGSARHIAHAHNCHITGIDLTQEYIETAKKLSDLVGLSDKVTFQQASALELPFENETFDVVWTEHVQMNIKDKTKFYSEIARVLKKGGRIVFHDYFQGDIEPLHYPTPWAEDASISSLIPLDNVKVILEQVGLKIAHWEDKAAESITFFKTVVGKITESGLPPLGFHLLMGTTAKTKLENLVRNFEEDRLAIVQTVAIKA